MLTRGTNETDEKAGFAQLLSRYLQRHNFHISLRFTTCKLHLNTVINFLHVRWLHVWGNKGMRPCVNDAGNQWEDSMCQLAARLVAQLLEHQTCNLKVLGLSPEPLRIVLPSLQYAVASQCFVYYSFDLPLDVFSALPPFYSESQGSKNLCPLYPDSPISKCSRKDSFICNSIYCSLQLIKRQQNINLHKKPDIFFSFCMV